MENAQGSERSVTLIIPTVHFRSVFFDRLLRYIADSGIESPIIVSDHSPPEHSRVIAGIVERHRHLDLKLLQHDTEPFVLNRFKGNLNGVKFYDEAYLVEDITNYKIGPHTDSARKVITLLFYLPKDESQVHLGTSIYLPKDRNFRCEGGPHYPFEWFERMATMPFRPNSLFTFVKGDTSFHGVEPVRDADCKRWLLLFDVFMEQVEVQTRQQPGWQASVQLAPASAMAAPAQAPAPQGAKFTF